MSVINKTTVKVIAELYGISGISDEVAQTLAQDVEYRIQDIAQTAAKFMRHSKRHLLTVDDVNHALKVKNVEPIYGLSTNTPLQFKSMPSIPDLYYVEDEELDLDEVMHQAGRNLIVPLDTTWTAHWLAIEGVQPAIPQNPPPSDPVSSSLSTLVPSQNPHSAGDTSNAASAPVPVSVKPLVQHHLSKELQLYYDKVTSAILRFDAPELQKVAFDSLAGDVGLSMLIPYILRWMTDKVTRNLQRLDITSAILSAIEALLTNPNIFIEPYLHNFMPIISTLLVTKSLSNTTNAPHWTLRHRAATLLRLLVTTYGQTYNTLIPRITRTLFRALMEPGKALTTHYGAIIGLQEIGHGVIRSLLIPEVEGYMRLLSPILNNMDTDQIRLMEANKVQEALLNATVNYIKKELERNAQHSNEPEPWTKVEHWESLHRAFGDQLTRNFESP